MIVITSPAKTLDFNSAYKLNFEPTIPVFVARSSTVVKRLKKCSITSLIKLFDISKSIADVHVARFDRWNKYHNKNNARPALLAYNGDIYRQLSKYTYSKKEQEYAQEHVRIISGLYGILRAYDLIQPYRLEMSIKISVDNKKNLYDFWERDVTNFLNEEIKTHPAHYIINLASHEYSDVIDKKKLAAKLISIEFRQRKNNRVFNYGLYAKRARGMMIEYMIKNLVTTTEELHSFKTNGYKFTKSDSSHIYFEKRI